MPLLSQPAPKPRPTRSRAKSRAAAQPVALVEGRAEFFVAGVKVAALPQGALWIESAQTLIVSDVHFEKGSAFARRGQMLPPYDTRAALKTITALADALTPQRIVSLGDSFHDVHGPERMDTQDRATLAALTSRCAWIWILGNHDPEIPATLGGQMLQELRIEGLVLRHEPHEKPAPGEIAGHLHPCAKVGGRGRSVRRRCFATDSTRLVMPAFGAYTGGLNLCDDAFARVFPSGAMALVLGKNRVLPAGSDRLLPD